MVAIIAAAGGALALTLQELELEQLLADLIDRANAAHGFPEQMPAIAMTINTSSTPPQTNLTSRTIMAIASCGSARA